jgi:hypothetical protein
MPWFLRHTIQRACYLQLKGAVTPQFNNPGPQRSVPYTGNALGFQLLPGRERSNRITVRREKGLIGRQSSNTL